MKFFDISWPISADMTAYKDKKIVRIEHTKFFERDHVRESYVTLGSHSGTHIDAPAHFVHSGITVEQLALDAACGDCRVLDLTQVQTAITRSHLIVHAPQPGEIILCKTRNSDQSAQAAFDYNFIYLAHDAALYLAECKIKAVGIDYLGIERNQPQHETHRILLEHGITLIEGLRLANVCQAAYELICLPLLIPGAEAAPARAILVAR